MVIIMLHHDGRLITRNRSSPIGGLAYGIPLNALKLTILELTSCPLISP